jgi:hypothetical protein
MKPGKKTTILTRTICFGSALALLFFLIASAPHRVHHFFEQIPLPEDLNLAHADNHHSGEHDHDQKPKPSSQQNDCVLLSVAQHSQVSAVQSFDIAIVDTIIAHRQEPKLVTASVFNFSPCSQRAPPLV